MKETHKRVISAVIGIVLLFFFINKGGIYLNTGVLLISLIGLREFFNALKQIDLKPVDYLGYLTALLIYLSNFYNKIDIVFAITFAIITNLVVYLFSKNLRLKDIGATLIGILYLPLLFSFINKLDDNIYIWLIFIVAFGTDTFAYLGGRFLGKRKLWPEISPNKTIEGSVSGVVGSFILTILFAYYIKSDAIYLVAISAIPISIFCQIGDLIASKIKRTVKLKDYGHIMPGHGGVLDRFDSIILASPLMYYYIIYFLN
nr:phosphatidate cytidylyltransferase [Tissierella sp.]